MIGVTVDMRAVYDHALMVEWLCREDGISPDEAAEWIDYNTIRSLPYFGDKAPIVLYPL